MFFKGNDMFFTDPELRCIHECIHDDEILYISNTEDSLLKRGTNSKVRRQNTMEEPSAQTGNFFVRLFRYFFPFAERPDCLHASPVSSEYSLPHPKVFVLHQKGLPLPEQYLEKVPPSTILIAVNPEDYLACNCFEAQPISLKHLRQEKQRGESICNTLHDSSS